MSTRARLLPAACLFTLVASAPVVAGLDIGDAAPPLSITEWIKGSPVDLQKDAKKIHVVEFWAVWCPPCKMSVPLLTRIQKKYAKDVVIIGVTEPDFGRNSPAAIRAFVKSQGDVMDYTVAIDSGKTTRAYMASAGPIGIPHAFIVGKDGRVAWQGSPLDPAFEDVLSRISAGTYDAKLAQKIDRRLQEISYLAQRSEWKRVREGLIEILAMDPAHEIALVFFMRISIEEFGDLEAYRKWARSHINAHRKNARAMSRLGDALSSIVDVTIRFPDIALDAAKAAYQIEGQHDATVIAVYARTLYQVGALDRAIALQQDAVALASADNRQRLQETYDYYRLCKKTRERTN